MKWTLKSFDELSLQEFHDIIQLRLDIFVVEQDCPYLDLDGNDQIAKHFYGTTKEGKIVAYTRLFGPKEYFEEASIGRVVVHKDFRKEGMGFDLMTKSIDKIEEAYQTKTIRIGAQRYLRKFYESLGFVSTDEFYMEDGIPHMYMIKYS